MTTFKASHWWALLFILFFPYAIMHLYSDFIRESELNARLGWLVMLGGFAYLTRHSVWLHRLFLVLLVIVALSGAMDILYAVTFSGVFTSASFEAITQSDKHEVLDFMNVYVSYQNVLILLIYLTLTYLLLKRMMIKTTVLRKEKVLIALAAIMLFVAVKEILDRGRTFDTVPGFNGVAIDYFNNHEGFQARLHERYVLDTKTSFSASTDAKALTYVVVIGESMNRNHLHVYGYPRETTPELDSQRQNLLIFQDIITSFAQTKASLSRVLTQSDTQNGLAIDQAVSLIGVFKRAGFKTWWLSNQQPMRMPFAGMAKTADVAHFISNDFHGVEVNRFDGLLVPKVETALQDPADKKVIFVHLMGSHLDYRNRYPENAAVFSDNDKTQLKSYTTDLSDSQLAYINSYDNSVHYTDAVLGHILKALETLRKPAALLFFADHGEEVFDTRDFKGHGPDGVTSSMVEVPFIFWRNQAYRTDFTKQDTTLKSHLNRPGLLEDVFNLSLCVTQVQSSLYEANKSLCSEEYQPRPRNVYGKDYLTLKGEAQ